VNNIRHGDKKGGVNGYGSLRDRCPKTFPGRQ